MSDAAAHRPADEVSKATKSELDWVRSRAARAGNQLDQEQSKTVISIARAFEEISESEDRAQLDTRLAMVEEQLERLLARRDEVERALEAELASMRRRVDEALEAIAGASEGQRGEPEGQGPVQGEAASVREPDSDFTELDHMMAQARSDLRIELHELRAWVEKTVIELGDLLEWSRGDFLLRIQASEEKASRAVVYLDALVQDLRIQQEQARREWSGMLRLIAGDLVRIEGRLGMQRPAFTVQYSPSAP